MKYIANYKIFENISGLAYEWSVAISHGDIKKMQTMIDNGFNINFLFHEFNDTALMLAIEGQKKDVIDFLLKQPSIDVNISAFGSTALTLAISNNDVKTAKQLLSNSKIKFTQEDLVYLIRYTSHKNASFDNFLVDYDLQKTFIENKRFDIIKLLKDENLINSQITNEFSHVISGTDLNLL